MRKFGIALAAMGAVFAVSLGGSALKADEQKPLNITFIIYTEAGNVFWNPALRGVQDAAKAFNANVDIQYADADPVKQNNIIETAIANKVDGIALTIFVPDAFTKNIQKARDAGIGVVAFNIDDPKGAAGSARQAFIGQDLSVAGYTIGKRMVDTFHLGKGDKIFAPVEYPEATYAVKRLEGVKKALDEVGATAEAVGTGAGFEEALPKMVQYLIGHPDTKAVISLGGTPTALAPQAISEAKLKIPSGGFDLNKLLIQGLQSGKIEATLDQQPYNQGYLPVMFLAEYARFGLAPPDVNTGSAIVDKSNVEKVVANTGTYR
jgi:simple sugar transport system substrate-binding protein